MSFPASFTGTVYFRDSSGIQYSTDNTNWTSVQSSWWPLTITNGTPAGATLKVLFSTDMTFNASTASTATNAYFNCGSDNIQFGSESLNSDGTRRIITITNIANFLGLIRNGTSLANGKNTISIYNISVNATGTTSLAASGGWVAQTYFTRNAISNYIINCTANSDLTNSSSGGIVGAVSGQASSSVSQRLTIIGCSFTGAIGTGVVTWCGGIIGAYAASSSGTVLIKNCFTTGIIGGSSSSGGIVGGYASAGCTVQYCYSTGLIGPYCGGIYGGTCTSAVAQYCYSLGNINTDTASGYRAGGIFGSDSNLVIASNCYSKGTNSGTNGIVGDYVGHPAPTITNCYAANGSWSDATASSNLSGVGTIWISLSSNTPYYLNNFGSSPFTLNNISSNNIVQTASSTLTAGSSTSAAPVANYKTFSIQSGGDSTITISNTGVISTTSSTPASTYTLVIYAVDDYTITTYTLTVNAAASSIGNTNASTIPPCCEPNVCNANPQISNYDSDVIINKSAGKAVDKSVENFYVGVSTGQRTAYSQPIFKSYYDYINYLQGKYK